jgi:hypothetical protein
MLLGRQQNSALSLSWNATELQTHSLMTLAVNQLGGMSQMPAAWGTVNSKYDAILAANCHPDYPIDRQVMFTACRGWLVRQDYSLPLSLDYLHKFSLYLTVLPNGNLLLMRGRERRLNYLLQERWLRQIIVLN